MKKYILFIVITFSGFTMAQTQETKEILINDHVIKTKLLLDHTTVRCSAIGYGQSELKISVPELDYYTFFDHSNIGEALPCMTAGICAMELPGGNDLPGHKPSDIIDPNNPSEEMEIRIVLKEILHMNHLNQTCTRTIREELSGELRGLTFHHLRAKGLGQYPLEICAQL